MQVTSWERWLSRIWQVLLISSLMSLSGCAAGNSWQYLPTTMANERTIFVVDRGWHTGIVLSREDLGPQLSFVEEFLRRGGYYEFGWGEAEFYQAEKVTVPIFLKAVFWKNPSVMHVASLPVPPTQSAGGGDVVELKLSKTGLERLKDKLAATFKFDDRHHPYPLKKGLYGESRFFKAQPYYVIFNTCNSWTAKVLRSGGVPMDTLFTLRAASVMRQAKAAQEAYIKLQHPHPHP